MRIVGVLGVTLAGLFVIGAVTAYGQINTRSQYGGTTAAVVDDKGNLRVPSDYRTAYQMLGSWAVAKDDPRDGPGSKQLHVVYASPGTIAAYRKDGHFPDGKRVHLGGSASDIVRRGADGLWRYLIDNNLGTAVRQPA